MKNKDSNAFLLVTGIIAGASAVLFLQSKKGQQLIDVVMSKGEELKKTAISEAQALISESEDIMTDIVDTSKEKLSSFRESSTIMKDVKEAAESKISDFQQGVEKAKKQINKA